MSALAKDMPNNVVCPIFPVSNVTGDGLAILKEFISHLKSRVRTGGQFGFPSDPVEYHIDRVFQVTGIGIVVNGTIMAGTVKKG